MLWKVLLDPHINWNKKSNCCNMCLYDKFHVTDTRYSATLFRLLFVHVEYPLLFIETSVEIQALNTRVIRFFLLQVDNEGEFVILVSMI